MDQAMGPDKVRRNVLRELVNDPLGWPASSFWHEGGAQLAYNLKRALSVEC